jgi:CHAD domain-containing protein
MVSQTGSGDRSFRLADGESVSGGLQRILIEELVDASVRLSPESPDEEDVHEARKRFKETRAVLRLLEPTLGSRATAVRLWLRDCGRRLMAARDAQSLLEAVDGLRSRFSAEWGPRQFGKIRRGLEQRRSLQTIETHELEQIRKGLDELHVRIASWPPVEESFASLSKGLQKTYSATRKAMKQALADRSVPSFHEWRKRTKECWYHAQLLENAWSDEHDSHVRHLHKLSGILGDHHDLAVLSDLLRATPEPFGSVRYLRYFEKFVRVLRQELEADAEAIGARLFEEKPALWTGLIAMHWSSWRERAPAPGAGLAVPLSAAIRD